MDPIYVDMEHRQPKAAEKHFEVCNKIDQHDRCHQQALSLDKIFTHANGTNELTQES